MRLLWLFGQFVLVVAWGALLIAVVIAIWYGFSFVVLAAVSRLFRFRGRTPDPPDDWTRRQEPAQSRGEARTESDEASR
jgi:hypothetical protein